MLYYYNKDGRFQKESSREYKTEKGAVDCMNKEWQGAVFDETGKMIISLVDQGEVSEGSPDINAGGSIPAFNEDNEHAGTVDAKTVAEAGETGRMPFEVQTTCDSLRIRSGAGKDCRITGYIREKAMNKKKHAIAEEKNGWGKLASGAGWIELAFTKKVS